jgi:hypothetical protein
MNDHTGALGNIIFGIISLPTVYDFSWLSLSAGGESLEILKDVQVIVFIII